MSEETGTRTAAQEPRGPAQPRRVGAPVAEDRDPDSMCTAMRSDGVTPCTRYRTKGSTVCQVHGAHKAPRARHAIATVAEKNGIVLPDVKPKDFSRIAAEVISWNLQQFAELGTELEKLRLLHSPVEHAREYHDIFSLLDQMGRTIATLTKAAAALPPIPDEPPVAPAQQQVMDALAGIAQRMGLEECRCCGSRVPASTRGSVDASEGTVEDPDTPVATVLPLVAAGAPEGVQVVTPEGDLL